LAVEDRLDGGLRHDEGLRAPLGHSSLAGGGAVVGGGHDPEHENGHQGQGGMGG
jgi:hypothetical protein